MNSLYVAVCLLLLTACTQAVNLGENCQNDAECTETVGNSHCWFEFNGCSHGTCTCVDNYYKDSETKCRMILNLGEQCAVGNQGDTDCNWGTKHSVCQEELCVCPEEKPEDMTVDGVHYCYHSAAGGDCVDENECLTYSISQTLGTCSEGRCGCADTAMPHPDNENVCREATINEPCSNQGVQCNDGLGLQCLTDVCECLETWLWKDGICMHNTHTMVNKGDGCTVDRTAQSARVCSSGLVCGKCPEHTIADPNICLSTGGASSLTVTITLLASTAFAALRMLL